MRLLCDVILVEFDSCMADPSTTESYGIFTSSADYLAKIPICPLLIQCYSVRFLLISRYKY